MPRLRDRTAVLVLLALGLAGSCVACSAAFHPEPTTLSPPEIRVERAAAVALSSWCVEASGFARSNGAGSGVAVDRRRILTAYHVPRCDDSGGGTPAVIVTDSAGGRHVGRLTEAQLNRDLAIVTTDDDLPSWFAGEVGPRPEEGGQVCLVTAVPSRERKCGEVQEVNGDGSGDVQHDALTWPGNSGSAVYDARGRLIGIVSHLRQGPNGQIIGGLFTSLERSRAILGLR
jgi:S1-C subfamily serine protease